MRIQHIHIDKYDWDLTVYYTLTKYYVEEISDELRDLECKSAGVEEAKRLISSGRLNVGLIYSNIHKRKTIMVIAKTSSPAEFLNSLVHETAHLAQHIGETFLLDMYGEEVCYLQGDIMVEMYDQCKDMLCEHCRKHV